MGETPPPPSPGAEGSAVILFSTTAVWTVNTSLERVACWTVNDYNSSVDVYWFFLRGLAKRKRWRLLSVPSLFFL